MVFGVAALVGGRFVDVEVGAAGGTPGDGGFIMGLCVEEITDQMEGDLRKQ